MVDAVLHSDVSSGQEGGLNDIAIEVLHLLLSHLLQSPPKEVGVHADQLSAFVTALRRGSLLSSVHYFSLFLCLSICLCLTCFW